MKVLPYGDRGLLVELANTAAVVACADAVRGHPALADVVPGARTVLLVARPGVGLDALRAMVPGQEHLKSADSGAFGPGLPREVVIPVRYDGPDLAFVSTRTGLSEHEVVAAHTGTPWRVAFGGFAPGFAYLVGGDPRLQVPRRDSPRTQVPAGSVGLAGEFSGIYPRSSPGGWQLIGRTDAVLWDLDRDPPALLGAGVPVRFEAT
ncbi:MULTISPECIES: 5-oxoprolinase subunit B family protein [unclassified Nocardioides]|uniref:5-oxoprolinase subunit B family protein n=1 Tax=unclassified Nocardioides TaxID=2615069 RepID=UPI0006FDD116|nr:MULTISPECIES: allophanate hydrolase subunit 1 [unclassified Nocardioides]KRA37478.1 allophanate hydrolase [Nocardioides sp. Root614]KRA91439.1 allophanate hydrolase [Nocardioides sp. Root682]